MSPIEEILRRIEASKNKGSTKLVAIDGRGGSGKSSLTAELVANRPAWKVLPVDAFPCLPEKHPWHTLGTQTWIDWERLRDQALLPLAAGRDAIFLRTPWWEGQLSGPEEQVSATGIVLVEGCYALLKELRDLYDFRIWVECSREKALENAIARDGENIRQQWEKAYSPNESSYIQAHNPRKVADIVVSSSGRKKFELIKDT